MTFQLSPVGQESIKLSEGYRENAYLDGKGVPTTGWGITVIDGVPVKMGMKITVEKAQECFLKDMSKFVDCVNRAVSDSKTSQAQFDAMVNLTYNIGVGGFTGSSVLRNHLAGNYQAAADSFLLWNKITLKGVKVPDKGLTNRRRREREMYLQGS